MSDDQTKGSSTFDEAQPEPGKKEPRDRFATLGERVVEQQRMRKTGSLATSVAYAVGEVAHTAMSESGPEQPSLSTLIGYAKMAKDGLIATKDAAISQGIRSAALHIEAKGLIKKSKEPPESDTVGAGQEKSDEARPRTAPRRDTGGIEI